MKKAVIDPAAASLGASYPPPHDQPVKGRKTWALTRQFGLSQFGVNRVELAPGSWSTQRHYHKTCDEVVVVVSGEVVVVTDDGDEILKAGDCIGFKAGVPNAHHLQNRSDAPAIFFDIGGRDLWDISTFPDIGIEARPHVEIRFRPIKK
jgi:uncharacterized cupin superfamily protein